MNPEVGPNSGEFPPMKDFYEALNKGVQDQSDLAVVLASLLQKAVWPDALGTARVMIDVWAAENAFDGYSTRYGDRSTTIVRGDTAHDPDGSGHASAAQKKGRLVAEVVAYLTASDDSALTPQQKANILREGIVLFNMFRSGEIGLLDQEGALAAMGKKFFAHLRIHREMGNMRPIEIALLVAVNAGLIDYRDGDEYLKSVRRNS